MTNVKKIPEIESKILAVTVLGSARKFYEIPENVAAFKKWQKERNQKRA